MVKKELSSATNVFDHALGCCSRLQLSALLPCWASSCGTLCSVLYCLVYSCDIHRYSGSRVCAVCLHVCCVLVFLSLFFIVVIVVIVVSVVVIVVVCICVFACAPFCLCCLFLSLHLSLPLCYVGCKHIFGGTDVGMPAEVTRCVHLELVVVVVMRLVTLLLPPQELLRSAPHCRCAGSAVHSAPYRRRVFADGKAAHVRQPPRVRHFDAAAVHGWRRDFRWRSVRSCICFSEGFFSNLTV